MKPPRTVSWAGLRPVVVAWVLLAGSVAWAQEDTDLTRLSLVELMNIEVSSSARKPQALSDTAAAVSVITREDIRRSGATSLPEALRLAPGVQVSRIDASHYVITIRGFASHYAGKMLVLQDGRTLFSPLFNGTFWEAQDPPLADIERIEVIRGPGGTMWGANAVNGVINIITRPAKDTQGTEVDADTGSEESGLYLRHGGRLGEDGYFRVYGKSSHHDALEASDGAPAYDALRQQRAGFRVDLQPNAGDRLTLQGDVQDVRANVTALDTRLDVPGMHYAPDSRTLKGANLLLRWEREISPDHHLHLQAYVDRVDGRAAWLDQTVDTLDLEFQQRLRLNDTHELTWGAGWRKLRDTTRGSLTAAFDPASASSDIYNIFVQDEVVLREDLRLTVGSKFEHNHATGLEAQPNVRLHWQATPTDSFWASVAHAVETPSRAVLNGQANYYVEPALSANNPLPFPLLLGVRGSTGLLAQEVKAREAGCRSLLAENLSMDLTVFHNRYDHLLSVGAPIYTVGAPYSVATYEFNNDLQGTAYGIEVGGSWQAAPSWRLTGSFSTLHTKLQNYAGGTADAFFGILGASPAHMWQLHSHWALTHRLDLDAHLYRSGAIRDPNPFAVEGVPAYTRLDLRLGWRLRPGVDLSLTGRNLLQRVHREAGAEDMLPGEIPRSWVVQGRWTL